LDSGGFSQIRQNGKWTFTPEEYVRRVRWYASEIGMPDFIAPMDWMCEPWVIAGRNQHLPRKNPLYCHGTRAARGAPLEGPDEPFDDAVGKHLQWTVENYILLYKLFMEVDPELADRLIPVIQGWSKRQYRRCYQMYLDAGIDLKAQRIVGLGSVCRRQATDEIADIVYMFFDLGLSLHGFGVKTDGLALYGEELISADSLAWSQGARYAAPLPGHAERHKNCANCADYALAWYHRVCTRMRQAHRPERQLTMF
ncbi:hypothetical protein AB0B89_36635, partial [Sphaerisporangium sp. NPDC049002]|uniref:deazapurine DNA modification protein DpdA family protein n=1 Tax=Sphaerisporangium sp. NPDC049002 TaxID=3155392 RepID=UPI0033FA22C4